MAAERAPDAAGPRPAPDLAPPRARDPGPDPDPDLEPGPDPYPDPDLPPDPAAARSALPRPPASVWVAAGAALVAALVMAWATSVVGAPLRAECLREATAATCAARTAWLDDARALQSALVLVAAALLVVTALRRARFVRRTSLLVLVLAVGSFFGAVLMASGGVPDGLLG